MNYDAEYVAHLHEEQDRASILATQARNMSRRLTLDGHDTAAAHLMIAADAYAEKAKALRLEIDAIQSPASSEIDPDTFGRLHALADEISENEGMNVEHA